jgi:PAS domain S-box-containing protein
MSIVLDDLLQDRAALYVSGEMTAPDREAFAVLVEYHGELRAHVVALQEAMTGAAVSRVPSVAPPAGLKDRLFAALAANPARESPDALVVTGADGLVEWVNPAFTQLCGYELAELKGLKPGRRLQGPGTDQAAVERIRESLRARRGCRETLVNYHKNGSAYRADIRITPILDDEGEPLWIVARERLVPEGSELVAS